MQEPDGAVRASFPLQSWQGNAAMFKHEKSLLRDLRMIPNETL